jgi:MSHA biogenesis protein MshP
MSSQFRRTQRGFSIVTAIFLIVVLAMLGVFIVSVTSLQQSGAQLDVQGVRAYQAARAGLEWGAYQVLDPDGVQLNGFSTCADQPNIPMPTCPADTHIGPGHPSGLAGSLDPFTVTVLCAQLADTTEGNRRVTVYQVVATACNQISGASCLAAVPGTGYVERRLTATLSKCRDSTASLPRCACGQ